jgi:hypothetical protein
MAEKATTPNGNSLQFDVDGVGHFIVYKEAPIKALYFSGRNELAALVGGQGELADMEARIQKGKDSQDEIKQEVALKCASIITEAQTYLDLKALMIEAPKDFNINNPTQFAKVAEAFNLARDFFRLADGKKTPETIPAS